MQIESTTTSTECFVAFSCIFMLLRDINARKSSRMYFLMLVVVVANNCTLKNPSDKKKELSEIVSNMRFPSVVDSPNKHNGLSVGVVERIFTLD